MVLLWLAPLNLLLSELYPLCWSLAPVTMEDFLRVQGGGSGGFHEVVGDLHGRLSDFILFIGLLFIVGMRLFGVEGVGFTKTLWSGLTGG